MPPPDPDPERAIAKLRKINAALIGRVERSLDHRHDSFSLFQTAVALDADVRARTSELKATLEQLATANCDLTAARDDAERANRSKTGFFTAVGHDLLQPLQAARLTLSTLADMEGDDARLRLVLQAERALSTVDELLRSILDLSRLDRGAPQPAMQPVRIDDLLETVRLALDPVARSKAIGLSFRATDLLVRSDPAMLRRIVQNLAANAVRYTDRGGVLMTARRRGGAVRLEVWDTGYGVAPLERELIFEEFARGSASRHSGNLGLGLGLSIVRRMAAALGHTVAFRSRPGRGSCFTVTAAEAEPGRRSVPEDPPADHGTPARTLVVLGEGIEPNGLPALLGRWGYRVAAAVDPAAASRAIDGVRPAGLVIDQGHGDPASTLAAIEGSRRMWGDDLPVVVLAEAPGGPVRAALAPRNCEWLPGPVKPAALRALLMHLLA